MSSFFVEGLVQRVTGSIAVVATVLHLMLGCCRLHAHETHAVGDAQAAECGHEHVCCAHSHADEHEHSTTCGHDDFAAAEVAAPAETQSLSEAASHSEAPPADCPCHVRCRAALQFLPVQRVQHDVFSASSLLAAALPIAVDFSVGRPAGLIDDDVSPAAHTALRLHLALGRLLI